MCTNGFRPITSDRSLYTGFAVDLHIPRSNTIPIFATGIRLIEFIET